MGSGYDQLPTLLRRFQLIDCLKAVGGVHVNGAHEPAWLVRSNRKDCDVDGTASRSYRSEFGMEAGIPRKEQRVGWRAQRPTAPERAIALAERSAGKVLGWNARQMEPLDGGLIPPIPFHYFASTPVPQKVACPQW
jgi:hypothetical protein